MSPQPKTIAELRAMPLSEIPDFEGRPVRTGSTSATKYKIAECRDPYASRILVIDRWGGEGSGPLGSRQIIGSHEPQWDQFIHSGV